MRRIFLLDFFLVRHKSSSLFANISYVTRNNQTIARLILTDNIKKARMLATKRKGRNFIDAVSKHNGPVNISIDLPLGMESLELVHFTREEIDYNPSLTYEDGTLFRWKNSASGKSYCNCTWDNLRPAIEGLDLIKSVDKEHIIWYLDEEDINMSFDEITIVALVPVEVGTA